MLLIILYGVVLNNKVVDGLANQMDTATAEAEKQTYQECKRIGDKEWGKKVYKQAENSAESSWDFHALADSLIETISDKSWAKKMYKKALALAEKDGEEDEIKEVNKALKKIG